MDEENVKNAYGFTLVDDLETAELEGTPSKIKLQESSNFNFRNKISKFLSYMKEKKEQRKEQKIEDKKEDIADSVVAEIDHYNELKENDKHYGLLIDKLYKKSVKLGKIFGESDLATQKFNLVRDYSPKAIKLKSSMIQQMMSRVNDEELIEKLSGLFSVNIPEVVQEEEKIKKTKKVKVDPINSIVKPVLMTPVQEVTASEPEVENSDTVDLDAEIANVEEKVEEDMNNNIAEQPIAEQPVVEEQTEATELANVNELYKQLEETKQEVLNKAKEAEEIKNIANQKTKEAEEIRMAKEEALKKKMEAEEAVKEERRALEKTMRDQQEMLLKQKEEFAKEIEQNQEIVSQKQTEIEENVKVTDQTNAETEMANSELAKLTALREAITTFDLGQIVGANAPVVENIPEQKGPSK